MENIDSGEMSSADLVRRTAAECSAFLDEFSGADWTTPIPEMDWSVIDAVAHMDGALIWYPTDLSAGPTELSAMDIKINPESTPADLVRATTAFAHVLACVIDAALPDTRGWHPFGIADASGFAAMACDEMLVHTDDAARGLYQTFTPTPELAERTLRRLFPWAPETVEPWDGLKWANGRVELPGLNRLARWRWHCAPLAEWDGKLGSPFASD